LQKEISESMTKSPDLLGPAFLRIAHM